MKHNENIILSVHTSSSKNRARQCGAKTADFSFREVDRNQVEEDEMGGPCSTNGGEEERL
jgi:hypothetical protein